MKKNDWIFIATVLCYSILFWKQMPGLNFFAYTIILLLGQILMTKGIFRNKEWLVSAIGTIGSAFCVMYYGNSLSIFATIVSLMMASYFSFNEKGSVLVGIFSSIISVGASIGFMISNGVERRRNKPQNASGNKFWKRTMLVLCALLIVLIFFFMYRQSSVLFYNLTQKINFDWLSFPWIGFTILGALIAYGFYYHNPIPGVPEWDGNRALKLSSDKAETWLDKLMSMESEKFSGILLLVCLNILLLIVNGLDLTFMIGGSGKLPFGVSLPSYVHQGVGMLITSIIFAILIILYFFRGRLNFSEKGKLMKNLALIWIIQNAFMLFSTACRNQLYIMELGLTYKRIGVDLYLLLTMIGLFVTAWKVQMKKTNAFLIRTNSWLFYGVWIIACFINWDALIFNNNTRYSYDPDLVYLNSLSNDILPEMLDYTQTHKQQAIKGNVDDVLQKRIFLFLTRQKTLSDDCKWPSYRLKADHNFDQLIAHDNFGPLVQLNMGYQGIKHIYFFNGFSNVRSLDLSGNEIENLGEIDQFKNLQVLDLSNNPELKSLSGIEKLEKLEYLSIYGCGISDYSPLLKMKSLKRIIVNNMDSDWTEKLQMENPQLVITPDFSRGQ